MQLEKIIKTLAEIDSRSAKIMEAASNEKKGLEQAYRIKKDEYQKDAEERTQVKLQELQERLKLKMQEDLSAQAAAAEKYLDDLEKRYESDHTAIAAGIFNNLTEV